MRPRIDAFALALFACNDSAPVRAPVVVAVASASASASVVPTPLPAVVCLDAGRRWRISRVVFEKNKATMCFTKEDDSEAACIDVDVATGAPTRAHAWVAPASTPSAQPLHGWDVWATHSAVTVCRPGVAKKLCPVIHVSPAAPADLVTALSDDGSRLFVLVPDLSTGEQVMFGDTFDVKTTKRLFRQRITRTTPEGRIVFSDPSNNWQASFIGKNLLLRDAVCCGPGASTSLFDPVSGALKLLHEYSGAIEHVSGSVYAVVDGKTLSFVDASTLASVGTSVTAPGKPIGDAEHPDAMAAASDGKLVFAWSNPPGYSVIDAATYAASTPKVLPICP